MSDMSALLAGLSRPGPLIRAARHGIGEYNRARDLKRLIRVSAPPAPERALGALIAAEARLEAARRQGGAGYSVARHVDLLIAMMAEVRLLPRAGGQAG